MADLAGAIRAHLEPVPTIDQWARWMSTTRDAILSVLALHHEEDGRCAGCALAASVRDGVPVLVHGKYPCHEVRILARALGIDPDEPEIERRARKPMSASIRRRVLAELADEEPLTRGIKRDR